MTFINTNKINKVYPFQLNNKLIDTREAIAQYRYSSIKLDTTSLFRFRRFVSFYQKKAMKGRVFLLLPFLFAIFNKFYKSKGAEKC